MWRPLRPSKERDGPTQHGGRRDGQGTNVGAAEDAETIGFNAAIRGGGERGAEHGEDGDGDGGNVHRRPLAPTWAERFIGITSSAPRETEERGDEVICANRTRMIVLKNKESRQKKALGKEDEAVFADRV